MSTSDLYLLNGKSTRHIAEFRNGWGSAPLAWDHIGALYISEKPTYAMDRKYLEAVWALANRSDVHWHHRIVLAMTFDRAFVALPHLVDASACCQQFGAETSHLPQANHWAAIGVALATEYLHRHTRFTRGVALSSTSVSDMWGLPSAGQLAGAWSIFDDLQQAA